MPLERQLLHCQVVDDLLGSPTGDSGLCFWLSSPLSDTDKERCYDALCECQQVTPTIYQSTCRDICQSCRTDVDLCVSLSLYETEYTWIETSNTIGTTLQPTRVRFKYQHVGSDSSQSTLTFEESIDYESGCRVWIDGELCQLCDIEVTCGEGEIGTWDCRNVEGINEIYTGSSCDSENLAPNSPFYGVGFLNLGTCTSDIGSHSSNPSPSPMPIVSIPTTILPPKKSLPDDTSKDDSAKLFSNAFDMGRGNLQRQLQRVRGW